MGRALVALLLALAGTGCFGPGASNCLTSADCASGSSCINGSCYANGDGGSTSDGGSGLPTIALTGCGVTGYLAAVTIGSGDGAKAFSLAIDTGSSTTAVAATTCSNCDVAPEFSADSSTQVEGQSAQSSYGDGSSWSGTTVSDYVQLMPSGPPARTIFAEITNQHGFFADTDCSGTTSVGSPNEGILGMGPPDLTVSDTQAFFTEFVATSGLPNVFSLQLCPTGNGHMWLGGYDSGYMSGSPQFTPIPSDSMFWQVTLQSVAIGSTTLGSAAATLVDSGTTINLLPTSAYNQLLSNLQSNAAFNNLFGSGAFSEMFMSGSQDACLGTQAGQSMQDVNMQLPSLTYTFPTSDGTSSFTLTLPATGSYLGVIATTGGDIYCAGVADATQAGLSDNEALLGDPFLSANISVFDIDNSQIGFAPETQCN